MCCCDERVTTQTVAGLVTVKSEQSSDTEVLSMTETSVNSRIFTAVVNVGNSPNELSLGCDGESACWVTGKILLIKQLVGNTVFWYRLRARTLTLEFLTDRNIHGCRLWAHCQANSDAGTSTAVSVRSLADITARRIGRVLFSCFCSGRAAICDGEGLCSGRVAAGKSCCSFANPPCRQLC